MEIMIFAIIVLGIAAEAVVLGRARVRAEREEAVVSRLARYAGRPLQ